MIRAHTCVGLGYSVVTYNEVYIRLEFQGVELWIGSVNKGE